MLPSATFPRGVSTLNTDASGTAPPDAFGPSRVLHQIGAGVLGPVFRAYQPDPGRLVAVKLFRLDAPPDDVHRFVAALDRLIASDLTHMGIAAPLEAGISEASAYLAMDFVAAESFDVVVRDYGATPVAAALRIAAQVGAALDFAAAVSVFHGALHPRDVLVSSDDARVTGLGIAQALEQIGVTPPIRRPYTAPERVAGEAWDGRADVFSLAALVYEMLCGRRLAGTGDDAAAAMPEVAGADMVQLRAIFARALAENPADRFDKAVSFAEALQGLLSEPSGKGSRAASPRRKRDSGHVKRSRTPATRPLLPADDDLPLAPDADLAMNPLPSPASGPGETAHEMGLDAAPAMPDLELREAEDARYELAESPTTGVIIDDASEDSAFRLEAAVPPPAFATLDDEPAPPPPVAAADRTEDVGPAPSPDLSVASAPMWSGVRPDEGRTGGVWPIALALVLGLLVGFAFGFGMGSRERQPGGEQAAVADTAAADRPAVQGELTAGPATATPPAQGAAPVAPSVPSERTQPTARAQPPEPAGQPTAPARAGGDERRLLVRSSPVGARVTIDGRPAGVTPLTVRDLALGSHTVRLAQEGYVGVERRVRIRSDRPAQSIDVALVASRAGREAAPTAAPPAAPNRADGSLLVDSRPSGARVFVDGTPVGTTPMLLDAVRAGDHGVRLELDGFSAWSTTARVTGGQRSRVSGSLERR